MWAEYRKTLIPVQGLIVLILLAMTIVWKVPLGAAATFALTMEVFAVVGASWAARLRARLNADNRMLPRR
jgi:hypothetical protein